MTNVVHYLVLGAVFVLEFAYRRIRFRAPRAFGIVRILAAARAHEYQN